jgi:hypothetical protein
MDMLSDKIEINRVDRRNLVHTFGRLLQTIRRHDASLEAAAKEFCGMEWGPAGYLSWLLVGRLLADQPDLVFVGSFRKWWTVSEDRFIKWL